MDSQLYSLRVKKIGVKIAMARLKKNFSAEDLALRMGMQPDEILRIEKGVTCPSLPQMQVLSALLEMPIDDLLNTQVLEPIQHQIDPYALPQYYEIRNKMLGIQVKKNRFQQNQSVDQLAQQSGISTEDLEMYESGSKAIPLVDLLLLSEVLHLPYEKPAVSEVPVQPVMPPEPVAEPAISVEETVPGLRETPPVVMDEALPAADGWQRIDTEPEPVTPAEVEVNEPVVVPQEWQRQEPEPEPIAQPTVLETVDIVSEIESLQNESASTQYVESTLPEPTPSQDQDLAADLPVMTDAIRDFISNPVNIPYLELAVKLSRMDAKKLREIAESLLEITL